MIDTKADKVTTVVTGRNGQLLDFSTGGAYPDDNTILGPAGGYILPKAGTIGNLTASVIWKDQDGNTWGNNYATVSLRILRATTPTTATPMPTDSGNPSLTGVGLDVVIPGDNRSAATQDILIYGSGSDVINVLAGDRISMDVSCIIAGGPITRLFIVNPSIMYYPAV
jgi:hypothetical protein